MFQDVHFRYHLVYKREDLTSDSRFKRSSTDGQFDGPGVVGVPAEQLEMAVQTLPLSQDGVDAWLAEVVCRGIHCRNQFGGRLPRMRTKLK